MNKESGVSTNQGPQLNKESGESLLDKGSQLNKESGISDEQGVLAEPGIRGLE